MKMPNWVLLKHRALRLFQRRKAYKDACDRQWTVCPREEIVLPPAIYLEDNVCKITGVQDGSSYAGETGRLYERLQEHAATIAYQLRNVHLLHGYAYKGVVKHPFSAAKEAWSINTTINHIADAALASSVIGSTYFAHWLTEDLTLALAARQLAEAVTSSQPLSNHQVEYCHLFDIHPVPVTQTYCDRLIIMDDFGQNRFKRERYEHMRNQLNRLEPLNSNHGVMLLRKTSGTRRLLINEMEIAEYLKDQGFTIIYPMEMSATDIARRTLGARLVIGVEGSHLVHGLFAMHDTSTLITLQPPYRFSTIYKDFTDCLGIHFACLVGDQVPEGFKVDLDDLARLLEKVDSEAS